MTIVIASLCCILICILAIYCHLGLQSLSNQVTALAERIFNYHEHLMQLAEDLDAVSATVNILLDEGDWADQLPSSEPVIATVESECTGPNCPELPDDMKNQLPHNGHAIIVGASGTGKSNLTMACLMDRIIAGQQIFLIDTKQELGPYFGQYCSKVVGIDGATELLTHMLAAADERQQMFQDFIKQHRKVITNLADYNQHVQTPLPYITIVIEELIRLESELGPDFIKAFLRLIAVGRSAGIFVLVATQYLNATILPKAASTNFGVRVYLGKYDRIMCQILFSQPLNQDEISRLGPCGFGIVEINGARSAQNFREVTVEMIEQWI